MAPRIKKFLLLCAALISIVLSDGEVMGAATQVGVSATVVAGKCKFMDSGSISFTLNPAIGGTAAGIVTQPTFRCSKDAFYSITDNKGTNPDGANRRMKHASLNEYIAYDIAYTQSGAGAGNGVKVPMDITATVPAANYSDASAGSYTDTIIFTITP